MEIGKIKNVHLISVDYEDVTVAWSNENLPFMLNNELSDKVLTNALEDCKQELRDLIYASIVKQMFKSI